MKHLKPLTNYFVMLVISVGLLGISAKAYSQANQFADVKFYDMDGNASTLADYKGKWVIVNLWATWCPPCLVEIPDLIMFHEKHSKVDAIVLGVNYEDISPEKVKTFAQSQMINYPIVRFEGKPDGKTTPFGPLKGLPTTYMVTPEGKVVAARTGLIDDKMLEEFIRNYNSIN